MREISPEETGIDGRLPWPDNEASPVKLSSRFRERIDLGFSPEGRSPTDGCRSRKTKRGRANFDRDFRGGSRQDARAIGLAEERSGSREMGRLSGSGGSGGRGRFFPAGVMTGLVFLGGA